MRSHDALPLPSTGLLFSQAPRGWAATSGLFGTNLAASTLALRTQSENARLRLLHQHRVKKSFILAGLGLMRAHRPGPPARAASIAAISIFRIVIIAFIARLAAERS